MLLLKKAFPIRNSNTSSFVVSFVSCKAQLGGRGRWCTPPARLAGEVPSAGLGVRQPDSPTATVELRAGSPHHSSHCLLQGIWNTIGKKVSASLHCKALFCLITPFSYFPRSDTVIFLFASQKVTVRSCIWSTVLFPWWLSSAYFHPLHTELSWHCACVCLVWWKSPDTGT